MTVNNKLICRSFLGEVNVRLQSIAATPSAAVR
jgi:hypothetical protein